MRQFNSSMKLTKCQSRMKTRFSKRFASRAEFCTLCNSNKLNFSILCQSYYCVRSKLSINLATAQFQQVYHHSNPITRAASFGSTKWKFNIRSTNHSLFLFFYIYIPSSELRAMQKRISPSDYTPLKAELRNLSLMHIYK